MVVLLDTVLLKREFKKKQGLHNKTYAKNNIFSEIFIDLLLDYKVIVKTMGSAIEIF